MQQPIGAGWVRPYIIALAGWLTVSAPAWGEPDTANRWLRSPASPAWQPVFQPFSWHREHRRRRRQSDPSFAIEIPGSLFDAYAPWNHAPQPGTPLRPAPIVPRERGGMWRDDVVGSGSGGRIEVHPEGSILRSRPRGD